MDDLTREQRTKNMRSIRSSHTKPEDIVGKFLFSKGLRYRRNDIRYPGKPDYVFPKFKTVVFVHGCFWHQHQGCKYANLPKTHEEYWIPKLRRNIERDKNAITALETAGWKTIVIWECCLRGKMKDATLNSLWENLTSGHD